MTTDLHKRLEEAAERYAKNVVPECISCYEEYFNDTKANFRNGAEIGFKEAIEVAKEWLKELIENNRYEYLDDDMVVYFETYMNKLWEEKK